MPGDNNEKYALTIRCLHWIMAGLIAMMLVLGFISASFPKGDTARHFYLGMHKSFGITLLALAVLRAGLKFVTAAPPLPDAISSTQRTLSRLGHLGLYGLMFLLPISGYVMSVSMGQPVRWFGLNVPRLLPEERTRGMIAESVHATVAYVLIAALTLHVGAVAWHYFRHRVNLLRRVV